VEESVEICGGSGLVPVDVEDANIGRESLVLGEGLKTNDALGEREVFDGVVEYSVRDLFEYAVYAERRSEISAGKPVEDVVEDLQGEYRTSRRGSPGKCTQVGVHRSPSLFSNFIA